MLDKFVILFGLLSSITNNPLLNNSIQHNNSLLLFFLDPILHYRRMSDSSFSIRIVLTCFVIAVVALLQKPLDLML